MSVETCVICGNRAARYVCQKCGRSVCEACFEPQTWLCTDCSGSLEPNAAVWKSSARSIPFSLFMVGLILIVAGTILLVTVTVLSEETVVAGAVIFVGPIPIVVGAGACFIWALVLAVALAILGILMFLICRKRAV